MKKLSILILEDEIINVLTLSRLLDEFGYNYSVANDMQSAIEKGHTADILIADINLNQEYDGIDIAEKLKLPTLLVTGYYDDYSKKSSQMIESDYLRKPYDKDVLKTLLNRLIDKYDLLTSIIKVGPYIYNKKNNSFKSQNEDIKLTNIELKIISILFKNINQKIPYSIFIDAIWGDEIALENRLTPHICRLRKKLKYLNIETINSEGFVLKYN